MYSVLIINLRKNLKSVNKATLADHINTVAYQMHRVADHINTVALLAYQMHRV